ncbi:MAG: type II toxin-antitoxin system RelE/ParE family toxin [Anaerolineae bacterium]|nr:type II toxin-antitoxin system RelE/ParE family toxin [Anaerolineae bacterium]
MRYRVEVTKRARKQIDRLPRPLWARVQEAIDALAETPRPLGCLPVKDAPPDTYRIRVGDYRVVYVVRDEILVVVVIRVVPRSEDAYKGLR